MNQSMFSDQVTSALSIITMAMESDGYSLSVAGADQDKLSIVITAGPDACADCLAPLEVLTGIISDALAFDGIAMLPDQIAVSYPAEPHGALADS
jgi:hypothetical protein